jgi:hypothetical protein
VSARGANPSIPTRALRIKITCGAAIQICAAP